MLQKRRYMVPRKSTLCFFVAPTICLLQLGHWLLQRTVQSQWNVALQGTTSTNPPFLFELIPPASRLARVAIGLQGPLGYGLRTTLRLR